MAEMQRNTDQGRGLTSDEIINECMVLSALLVPLRSRFFKRGRPAQVP